MKSPSQYGSNRNEETSFIRRVAAPDRPNANRRQKKRLAMAGAAATLIGASAGVGYATLRATQTSAVAMPAEQQMAASLEVPDFVEAMGDPYYPSFDELDKDGDGIVSYTEYMKDLNEIWSDNREKIAESALPEVVKEDLNSQLDDKIESDTACVKKAMITSKKRQLTFDRSTINSLYYMLEVFCFDTPIEVPQKYMEMFPDTPVTPPTPVVPDVVAPSATEAATSAPIVIPTTGGGQQKVTLVGPPDNGQQKVEIETGGGVVTTTVTVQNTAKGDEKIDIPSPGGDTTTVIVPQDKIPDNNSGGGDTLAPQTDTQAPQSGTGTFTGTNQGPQSGMGDQYNTQAPQQQWPSQNGGGGGSQQQQTIDVYTPQGPATVTTDGPVINGKQDVTITTSDGSTTHTTADVIQTSGNTNTLVISTGSGGETTTVTVPQTNAQSGTGDQYNTQAPQPQTGDNFDHEDHFHFDIPQVLIETVNGPVTVLFDGPIIDNRQMVTIINVDDSSTTLSLPVTANSDDKNEVEVPTGPGDATTMVEVPEWPAVDSLPKIRHVKPKQQQIAVDTPNGPVTVTTDGPVIDGKQQVTISDNNGDTTTTTVKVTTTTDGNSDLEIPTTNGQTTIVTIPQTSTQAPEVNVITADGPVKVTFDGSIHDGKQDITVTTSDGSKTKETVDVTQTSDGNNQLDISTGSGSQKTTVTVPQTSVQVPAQQRPSENGGGGSQKTIAIDTADGPAVVTFDGPVIDGKQQVTITDNQGNSDTTLVDVTQTSQGTKADIPTGSGGATTTVTVPSGDNTPTTSQDSNQASSGATVNTPQGPVTVTADGPVIDGKQDVTITTSTGTTTQTTAKVVQTSDSTSTLVISTGPGGQTTTVTVPTDNQTPPSGDTSDILKKLGENDVDNGDKDFMTKDEFQLQIGSHFAEKIMALKEQTRAEDTETDKILKNQKKLEDCILEASEKFGYYGVYEQAPHFDNAVHWIDNDCLNQ
ncbi:hypothetical protein PF005_g14010 [Phytophthora fragariae]|uniref:EF-hand domain-containing protein n=1 Tax=Phytophthora fragariae TaxID=53985 RepID=A0A6A3RVC8_9STRA|nr:hypothetical protein PF003_g21744 [Phytophthora fragariae]KAE8934700.1 hypothetical protein PF009_g15329 [Phytophthora fragariae]KAE9002545.1 hypothetical protein PF011_g13270 [Phytophthora fragariae]KAE9103784.1 hypothetical protein PF007_g14283 [Phytophthora fragariae]KAE9139842.1 hypothetical protein PF006_g13650 [Phytophthora fragariae]